MQKQDKYEIISNHLSVWGPMKKNTEDIRYCSTPQHISCYHVNFQHFDAVAKQLLKMLVKAQSYVLVTAVSQLQTTNENSTK